MLDTSSLEQSLETSQTTKNNQQNDSPTADDLLQRCNLLITELEAFQNYLKQNKQEQLVEIAHFRNTVKSEFRTLERLAQNSLQSQEATQHTVNSSNLPFLETVWSVVKNTRGLQALQKRYYWQGGLAQERAASRQVLQNGRCRNNAILDKKKQSALVDVVGGDGIEWIKVSLITNTRLLFDKAKQGWEEVSSSEDEDDDDDEKTKNEKQDEDDNDIPLIKMAKDLFKAAKVVRIRTNHPRIRLVLPKIEEGQVDEIDDILEKLRQMGCTVETSNQAPAAPPLDQVINNILTDPFASLTPTLNIDCTILLALVSDFSHCSVEAEPWFHRALKRQVEIEDKENLLPNLLYPAIAGHSLVCTKEAAKRMHEIVDTIGTPGERARTKLFIGSFDNVDNVDEETEQKYRDKLQEWSKFKVPSDLHLPIKVVDSGIRLSNNGLTTEQVHAPNFSKISVQDHDDQEEDESMDGLPPAARYVKENLTWINQSVFLHGWANARSTITSNRTVVKQIDSCLETHALSDKEWPHIWLCPTARSLVGKEKARKE